MVIILSPGDRMRLEEANKPRSNVLTGILEGLTPIGQVGQHHFIEVEDHVFFTATILIKRNVGTTSMIYSRFKELGRLQTEFFDRELARHEEEMFGSVANHSSMPS